MKLKHLYILLYIIMMGITTHTQAQPFSPHGVSACYAGAVGNWLVMAGGANFADKPVAEGGRKCFYSDIYAAEITNADTLCWQKIGSLPQPMAYGSSVVCGDCLLVIGGSNSDGLLDKVYSISIADGQAIVKSLPSLPVAIDNTAGCLCNGKVYAGGGMWAEGENRQVFCLDMDNTAAGWQETDCYAGVPTVQPVLCVWQNKPLFIGGFQPKTDAHEAQMFPGPTGGALAQTADGTIYMAGGVNREIFIDAISGRYNLVCKEDYLKKPVEWYRFNDTLCIYNPATDEYTVVAKTPEIARAGCALVVKNNKAYVIQGEIKPGIRTNKITTIQL